MKPIVIKVGTGVLTKAEDGTLDEASLSRLVSGLSQLIHDGQKIILVSSGAVGAGVSALNLIEYPTDTATKQAAASIGQVRLMQTYQNLFTKQNTEQKIDVAQLLISYPDLNSPIRMANILKTLNQLFLHPNIIPIINENDTVSTKELCIGDNDVLSARIATIIGAQKLLLLTSVDGLLDETGTLIPDVHHIQDVHHLAKDEKGAFATGGMTSKLQAVEHALSNGIPTQIANGEKADRLKEILNKTQPSTTFHL